MAVPPDSHGRPGAENRLVSDGGLQPMQLGYMNKRVQLGQASCCIPIIPGETEAGKS
jgi:hypothetical protein